MIFVDTGAWAAAELGGSVAAEACRTALETNAERLATSTAVLTELWMLLAVRRHPEMASEACQDVAASSEVLTIERRDHERALGVLRSWPGAAFSYGDATSFVVMEREGLEEALALDAHFRIYRYGRDRRRAFLIRP